MIEKLMARSKTIEQIIAADPLTPYVRKGANQRIARIVYSSILKSKEVTVVTHRWQQ